MIFIIDRILFIFFIHINGFNGASFSRNIDLIWRLLARSCGVSIKCVGVGEAKEYSNQLLCSFAVCEFNL